MLHKHTGQITTAKHSSGVADDFRRVETVAARIQQMSTNYRELTQTLRSMRVELD